jgi:hypothetical protein
VVGPAHEKVVELPVGRGGGSSLFWPGVLVGIGIAGTLDEVVLHQLLVWHHFYDRSTPTVGLVSDGLFHLFSTTVLVIGIIQLVGRRHTTPDPPGPRPRRRPSPPHPPAQPVAPSPWPCPDALRYTPPPRRPVRPHRQPEWRSGSASDS